ncbi:T9SS type A sorting domain-containing protein [Hymenobacter metallicola]|uniref:T9SS type A sorting domain-containing protein n=1 Tax=Hymenobacter metallicola TaxID=2563114 RepID=A0A4Z0QEI8_9BACT|nr:T9SS type A sorting domain-containing protein [Hymenobacter metallicola]TGE27451.1 T9SS type A sorting domain-containing protein [Hymenobacter metallicola]
MFSALRFLPAGFLLTVGLLGSSYQAAAQTPTKQWDRRFGGNQSDSFSALQRTPDGGYLLAGSTVSSVGGDVTQAEIGNFDYWLVKIDASGTKLWDKRFGGFSDDYLSAVQPTADGGYLLVGSTRSLLSGDITQDSRGGFDGWVVKIDANGNKLWNKRFGGSADDFLRFLQPTADGGCVLGGSTISPVGGDITQPSRGGVDYWLLKIDANGTKLWDKRLGGSADDGLNSLTSTADGGFVLGGSSVSAIGNDKTEASRGASDYWLVKVDASGTKLWDKTVGGTANDYLNNVLMTADGGYLLAGSSDSPVGADKTQGSRGVGDYWAVKLDANRNKQWDKRFGGESIDQLSLVLPLSDGGYLLAGDIRSNNEGDVTESRRGFVDFWLVKIDASGTKLWDKRFGGTAENYLVDILPTPDGGALLGSETLSGLGGDKSQGSRGSTDFWVMKLNPFGTITGARPAAGRQQLGVYPNPAHQRLRLRLPEQAPRTGLHLSLLDATGRVVSQQALAAPGPEVWVELGSQRAGLYLLRLEGPDGYLATQRAVLE